MFYKSNLLVSINGFIFDKINSEVPLEKHSRNLELVSFLNVCFETQNCFLLLRVQAVFATACYSVRIGFPPPPPELMKVLLRVSE